MNKKRAALFAAGLVLTTLFAPRAAGYLSDMAGHWGATVVTSLEVKGIINGGTDGRFEPDRPLTRAELAKMLTIGLGYEADADLLRAQASRFVDVPFWHWARGYVELVAELGVAEGYPDARFGPSEGVSRAEIAAFAVRAAGLAERARVSSTEVTAYGDDGTIPSWARGSVFVARAEGLMTGLPDGNFYPDRLVTRAEGAAVVYRLLARNGSLFHLAGTLTDFDPERRSGTVRDAMGIEHDFRMQREAVYLRDGAVVPSSEIRPLDDVLVVLDEDGRGQLMEGRYVDLLAERAQVLGDRLQLQLPSGETHTYPVLPGALILLNGRAAQVADLSGAGPLYVALDGVTGSIRLVDALRNAQSGIYIGAWGIGNEVQVAVDEDEMRLALAPDPVVLINDERANAEALLPGDVIRFALDDSGRLSYLEVTR